MKASEVVDRIEKRFGKEAIAGKKTDVSFTSSGCLSFDLALGGGIANGRIVEFMGWESSGKTTGALQLAAETQKEGKKVAYVDVEQALDLFYAESLGVDVDIEKENPMFYLSQPDCAEDALEITREFAKSEEFGLIVVDSVAALVPKAVIQGEAGDAKMAIVARMMSQIVPTLVAPARKSGCKILFISQFREKIGVMFGCFDYKSAIVLEDGSTEWIGKIVNQKLPVKVMSFNQKTGKCEPKKILNYYKNGKAEEFLKFTIEKPYGNGRSRFSCTGNHLIFTPNGEINAENLNIGDYVLARDIFRLSDLQLEIVYGSLLGDGHIKKNGSLAFGHGEKQIEYCKWKQSYFSNISYDGYTNSSGGWSFETKRSAECHELRHELYLKNKKRTLTSNFLNKLTPLSIAVWYMDDASLSGSSEKWGYGKVEISVQSYDINSLEFLINRLKGFNLNPTLTKQRTLLFSGENSKDIQNLVCKYIHPSMQYKLSHHFQNKFEEIGAYFIDAYWGMKPFKVLNKEVKVLDDRYMSKFDLEIEDNHNYLVDGVGVHNSPTTTTGGNALKFYASQRVEFSRIGQEKDGDEVLANKTRVKVIKNKVAPPFKKAEFDIIFGEGYDTIGDLIDLAVDFSIIDKKGSWFSYQDSKLGQGRASVRTLLGDNPELYEEIQLKLYETLGL